MKKNVLTDAGIRKYGEKAGRVLILILYLLLVVLLLDSSRLSSTALHQYDGNRGFQEASWVFRKGNEILEPAITTPAFRHMETGEIYSISTVLTYDGSQDPLPSCFYFVDHMYTRVLLDGEVLFSYFPEDVQKPDRSRSPGNVYTSVPLPGDCQGRELTIEFLPALWEDIEFQLPNPIFGNFSTVVVHTFRMELPQNVIVILSAFLGVLFVVISTFAVPGRKYREGLLMGVFATLFSLYNLTESDFDFHIISNPYYTYLLDYTTFTLIPIFLMAFLRERLPGKRRVFMNAILTLDVGMYLTENVLHFTGIMDMREFLPILHLVYGAEFVTVFVMILTMKKNRRKTLLVLQMTPILLGAVVDSSVYYFHWQLGSSDSTFTACGVVIFMITELYSVWRYSLEVYGEAVRSQEYQKMAYVDALTGIGNRRAFDVARQEMLSGSYDRLILSSVDVNDLKKTNDTLGHAAGDFLIRSAADVLEGLSEGCGHAYRVGGDEFIVLLSGISEAEFHQRLEAMEQQIQGINSNSEIQLSLAVGYAFCRSDTVEAAMEQADKMMYERKAQYKKSGA